MFVQGVEDIQKSVRMPPQVLEDKAVVGVGDTPAEVGGSPVVEGADSHEEVVDHTLVQTVVAAHSLVQMVVAAHSLVLMVVAAHILVLTVVADHTLVQMVVVEFVLR